jgi:hypothetical protein
MGHKKRPSAKVSWVREAQSSPVIAGVKSLNFEKSWALKELVYTNPIDDPLNSKTQRGIRFSYNEFDRDFRILNITSKTLGFNCFSVSSGVR